MPRNMNNPASREAKKRYMETWAQRHKDERREQSRRWREKHRDEIKIKKSEYAKDHRVQINASAKRSTDKLVVDVLLAYGGQCACCGERNPLFLTLDHVNNDGSARRSGGCTRKEYFRARQEGYPDDLQLLCWNCNMGKARNGGVCPHNNLERI